MVIKSSPGVTPVIIYHRIAPFFPPGILPLKSKYEFDFFFNASQQALSKSLLNDLKDSKYMCFVDFGLADAK